MTGMIWGTSSAAPIDDLANEPELERTDRLVLKKRETAAGDD